MDGSRPSLSNDWGVTVLRVAGIIAQPDGSVKS